MTDFEETKTGVRRNEQGQIDMSVYQANYEGSPIRNQIDYVSLKKINSTDEAIPLKAVSLYGVFYGNSSVLLDTLNNSIEKNYNFSQFKRSQERYGDKPLKSEDGIFYQIVFDIERLKSDVEKYDASEQSRIRSFQDDALEEYGIQDKPWASKAYAIAYDHGHSSGFSEVLACLDEPVEFAQAVESSLNVDFYERKTKEAYILLKDVLDSLPSTERGKRDWLNPDTELNMKQFVNHVGKVIHPKVEEAVSEAMVASASSKKKAKAKLTR